MPYDPIERSKPSVPPARGFSRREFIKTAATAAATAAVIGESGIALAQDAGKPVTLALVGCAHIHTPSYAGLLAKRPDVKVKYVWDHDPARAAKRAGEVKARVAADPAEVWSDRAVSGVVICSETNRHHDLVVAAARAGKPMFVEKPLGITSKESREMAAAIEKAGLLFTTGYFMRTQPHHLFLKDQVGKGAFGRITRARGSNCHSGSLGGWFDTEWRWMADPKIAGVGAFGDLGTHSLDILMWLLGDVASVAADIKVVTGRYGDCDETGEALLRFKSGVIGTLAAGWVDVENPVALLISGTEGHAVIVNDKLYFRSSHVPGADGKTPWADLPPALPAPMDQFVDAVSGKKVTSLVTPGEAAARVAVMEAAYAAARGQAWVEPA
ncbi:MAG TPA: Gfo/Idh/MocA family oxidoreductase [Terriglobales bacterium]|nr:Gfo/Idh/MocA family oxidoreductase [Terriglobales bacterium]